MDETTQVSNTQSSVTNDEVSVQDSGNTLDFMLHQPSISSTDNLSGSATENTYGSE